MLHELGIVRVNERKGSGGEQCMRAHAQKCASLLNRVCMDVCVDASVRTCLQARSRIEILIRLQFKTRQPGDWLKF